MLDEEVVESTPRRSSEKTFAPTLFRHGNLTLSEANFGEILGRAGLNASLRRIIASEVDGKRLDHTEQRVVTKVVCVDCETGDFVVDGCRDLFDSSRVGDDLVTPDGEDDRRRHCG
jgi:hypothetical protein